MRELADALDGLADCAFAPYVKDLREAARILRAADAADVGHLIDNYGLAVAKGDRDATIKYRAALESALRVALAPKAGFVQVPFPADKNMIRAGNRVTWPFPSEQVFNTMIAAAQAGAQEPMP